MPGIKIRELLRPSEIERCIQLHDRLRGTGQLCDQITAEIIQPNLARFEEQLGQKCDARYLGYLIEKALCST